jgi:hypothetical protein
MLGQSTLNRVFVYEVEGLRQNEQTNKQSYPIRNSSTIMIQVPYNRMNDEMRRITRLGGKIVGIHPLGAQPSKSASKTESKAEA